jgi:amidase
MTEPCELSAMEARRLIGAKKLSPVELLDSCVRRIELTNPILNAFVAIDFDRARSAARRAEASVMGAEPLGVLHGIPVGIKDLEATAGLTTTWGSLIHKNHIPEADDPHVARIRSAGGIVLGKTNTPEFGAGSNTTNLVYGVTGNPFDPKLTCGGSSGGSAVALAAGMVPLATGSDYGGSLRTPAAFCGVVGYRPSPGIVPNCARVSSFPPFAVLGPMARTVDDAHLLLTAQIGAHPCDPFSDTLAATRIPARLPAADLSGVRMAYSADLGCAPIDHDIRKVFERRIAAFAHAFASADARSPELGRVAEAFDVLRGLYCVEEHHGRLKAHRNLLGRNVIDNTERGLRHSIAAVAWAKAEQNRIQQAFNDFFKDTDVLICPATAVTPFPSSELYLGEINNETLPNYMSWYTVTWALTVALPSILVLPAGLDDHNMPFGLQIVGPMGSDARILSVALALEDVLAASPETRRPVPDPARLIQQHSQCSTSDARM